MRRILAAAAVVLFAAAGCATSSSQATGFQIRDSQQAATCDGVPAPATGRLGLLRPDAEVVAAVICKPIAKYVAGQGIWRYSQVFSLPSAKIPELGAGLREPDVAAAPNRTCDARLVVEPDFVLTLADGSRIRPAVPGDGCHPQGDSLKAFDGLPAARLVGETRTTQVFTDLEATSNCGPAAKSPAFWLSAAGKTPGLAAMPSLPAAGSVSICRYRADDSQFGTLSAAGIVAVPRARELWSVPSTARPSDCNPPADVMQGPAVDWLMVLPTPKPPYTGSDIGAGPSLCWSWVAAGGWSMRTQDWSAT